MYDEALLARIREYIAQNQATYTLAALRRKLIEEGVPPEAIDIAIAQLHPDPYRGPAVAQQPQQASRGWTIGKIILVMLGVSILNIAICAGAFFASIDTSNGWPFFVTAGVLVVAEIVGAIKFANTNKSVSIGLILAIVATPALVFLILLGICLVIIVAYSN